MPLSAAKPMLEAEIFLALQEAGREISPGDEDGPSPTDINQALATKLANAIHDYTIQAVVSTQVVTVLAGVAIGATVAGPVTGAGMGTGTGMLM